MAESTISEKFESKAQQGLFWSRCGKGKTKEEKKWCKMAKEFSDSTTKKDYKKMPEKIHPEKSVKVKTNENLEKFLEEVKNHLINKNIEILKIDFFDKKNVIISYKNGFNYQ